jgi:hypothetical protein
MSVFVAIYSSPSGIQGLIIEVEVVCINKTTFKLAETVIAFNLHIERCMVMHSFNLEVSIIAH